MIRGLCFVLTTCVFAGANAQAADFVKVGQVGKVAATFIGCKDKDDLDRIRKLFAAGDKEAVISFASRKAPDCRAFRTGATGTVESLSVWSNASCVREKGDPDCYWIPLPLVVAP